MTMRSPSIESPVARGSGQRGFVLAVAASIAPEGTKCLNLEAYDWRPPGG